MEEILAQYKPNMTPAMLRQLITTAVKILPSILAKHSASNRIPSRNNKKSAIIIPLISPNTGKEQNRANFVRNCANFVPTADSIVKP